LIPGAERINQVAPCETPTLHQLLTHTSGLSYAFNDGVLPRAMAENNIGFDNGTRPLAEAVDCAAALPLAFEPGKRWEYSVATGVLGQVVELVLGKSLDVVFQDEIFGPLGMAYTGFSVPVRLMARLATLYVAHENLQPVRTAAPKGGTRLHYVEGPSDTCFRNPVTLSGGGGLTGTLDDYMRFCEMLRLDGIAPAGQLLSPQRTAFMLRNHLPGDIARWGRPVFPNSRRAVSGSGLPARSCWIQRSLARRATLVILAGAEWPQRCFGSITTLISA
jgi:CubicO group peptidase (beta-lactamase class C family)